MQGSDLTTYLAYVLSARRVELALVGISGGLAAVMWQLSLPEIFPRPGLPPDRTVQLFSALLATSAAVLLRPLDPVLETTAVVPIAARRTGLGLAVSAWLALVTVASAALMSSAVGTQHMRNVAVYFGAILALRAFVGGLAWMAPWLWLSASLIAGYELVPGHAPRLRDWAYPLQPGWWNLELTVGFVIVGGLFHCLVGEPFPAVLAPWVRAHRDFTSPRSDIRDGPRTHYW